MSSQRESDAFHRAVALVQRFVCAYEQGQVLRPGLSESLPSLRAPLERLALDGLLYAIARRLDRRGELAKLVEVEGLARAVELLARHRLREGGPFLEPARIRGREWLKEVAADYGWSAATVRRKLGGAAGMPPREMQQRERIHHAIDLIRSGMKIAAVGHSCGYKSERAFFAAFKSLTGITPAQMREMTDADADSLRRRIMPGRRAG